MLFRSLMGWAALIAIRPLIDALGMAGFAWLAGGGLLLMLAGCAGDDPIQAHTQGCAAGGHAPGSQAFAQCMARAHAVVPSDEARERRRWLQRLQREQVEAEARVRRERGVLLARP